jgi:signal transduction histidine kinase
MKVSISTARRKLLGRHSFRARIALACAGLFLVAGGALVASTYALLDHSLPSVAATKQAVIERDPLYQTCEHAHGSGSLRTDPSLAEKCRLAFAGGARLGADTQRTNDLHDLLLWSLIGLTVTTILAGILGWAVGRRILRPLHQVESAARQASETNLSERVALGGPEDELKRLADTFDDMLNRLEVAFSSQRRFVANASHELRTPLTTMRTLIDVAMAKPSRSTEKLEVLVSRVRQAVVQSEAIIDGLLTSQVIVDLPTAAQDAIDAVHGVAEASNVEIESELSPAQTLGDRALLERLVANLVDNAVRYNSPGGSVRVVTRHKGDEAFLSVTNTGPEVPEELVPSLFEPFRRIDERLGDRTGAGLGLSIVKSVADAHKSRLEAHSLPAGGLQICVWFRQAASDSSPSNEVVVSPEPVH